MIVLENTAFDRIAGTGILSQAQFRANTSGFAQDANDRIIYETATGRLFHGVNVTAPSASKGPGHRLPFSRPISR